MRRGNSDQTTGIDRHEVNEWQEMGMQHRSPGIAEAFSIHLKLRIAPPPGELLTVIDYTKSHFDYPYLVQSRACIHSYRQLHRQKAEYT